MKKKNKNKKSCIISTTTKVGWVWPWMSPPPRCWHQGPVTDRTLKTSCAFLNGRAWLCCPGGGGGGEHNTGACCHGNPGQLMRHQSQNKSFSVFAASDFFSPPCYNQVVSLSSVCHTAAFPKAWEDNRTFEENGAVWAEIREWAGGGKEGTRGRPRRGLEAELCDS